MLFVSWDSSKNSLGVKPFPVTGALRFAYISKIECQHPILQGVNPKTLIQEITYSELKLNPITSKPNFF